MQHDDRQSLCHAWLRNLPPLPHAPPSLAAFAAAVLTVLQLGAPLEAAARAQLTPDERVTIEVFKKATPSVVNVSNLVVRCCLMKQSRESLLLALSAKLIARVPTMFPSHSCGRRDTFTTDMTEIPQGQGSGFIYDKQG